MRLTPGNGLGGALDCGDEGRMITDDDEQEGRNQSAASARSNTSLESTVAAATRRRPILVEPNLVRELGKVVRILKDEHCQPNSTKQRSQLLKLFVRL